jgi:hypothetical protein
MRIGRENRCTRRKPDPLPLCPPQIPHDLGSNPRRHDGKPATNRLSCGTGLQEFSSTFNRCSFGFRSWRLGTFRVVVSKRKITRYFLIFRVNVYMMSIPLYIHDIPCSCLTCKPLDFSTLSVVSHRSSKDIVDSCCIEFTLPLVSTMFGIHFHLYYSLIIWPIQLKNISFTKLTFS